MVSNSVLRSFLTLSILLIVTGILVIVFIQFDRGYVVLGLDKDFEEEQENLINHVYRNQLQAQESGLQKVAVVPTKTVMVVEPEAAPAMPQVDPVITTPPVAQAPVMPPRRTPVPQAAKTQSENVWNTEQQNDYYSQLLRNNPWSPHFQPGQ